MTRKEVIDWLYRLKSHVSTFMPKIWHEKFIKALQFAIASLKTDEAYQLEYEKPEICEDCIDRDYLIRDLYCKAQGETSINIHWLEGYIKQLPSVLPKATKNDCENCIHNKGVLECDMYGCKYEPTTKNDLGVDAISRQEAIDTIRQLYLDLASQKAVIDILKVLPSVTPQEPFINKPCISGEVCEHDKQKVLDKIRAEIEAKCCITVGRENDGAITLYDLFEILDKYKGETEE